MLRLQVITSAFFAVVCEALIVLPNLKISFLKLGHNAIFSYQVKGEKIPSDVKDVFAKKHFHVNIRNIQMHISSANILTIFIVGKYALIME